MASIIYEVPQIYIECPLRFYYVGVARSSYHYRYYGYDYVLLVQEVKTN